MAPPVFQFKFIFIFPTFFVSFLVKFILLPFSKTNYNIEEEDFYPAKPVKDGYTFTNWDPEYIPSGSTGNYNFIANYAPNN